MYTNYSYPNMPMNQGSNFSNMPMGQSNMPMGQSNMPMGQGNMPMSQNSNMDYMPYNQNMKDGNYQYDQSDDRLIGGGFFGPFLLGGITGGLLAPAFYQRPYYNNYYYPYPNNYYGGYY